MKTIPLLNVVGSINMQTSIQFFFLLFRIIWLLLSYPISGNACSCGPLMVMTKNCKTDDPFSYPSTWGRQDGSKAKGKNER